MGNEQQMSHFVHAPAETRTSRDNGAAMYPSTRFAPSEPPRPQHWLGLGLLVCAACLTGLLVRSQGFLPGFWPANALMLGVLLRYPGLARQAPAWVAGALAFMLADLLTGTPWAIALWLNTANMLAVATGWLVLRVLDEPGRCMRRASSALYLLLAALAASAVGALVGCGTGPAYFGMPWPDLLARWFSIEMVNYMLITPVVLTAPRADDPPHDPPPHYRATLLWRAAPAAALLAAEGARQLIGGPGALGFAVPGLLWCALSYRVFTTTVLSLIVCLWTLQGVSHGLAAAGSAEVFSLRVGVALLGLGPLAVACAGAARTQALHRLRHAVRHDDLTGALARRAFLEQSTRLLDRATQDGTGLAVLMLDVDHFKQVNDRHGHHAGDQLLVELTHTMAHALRPQDLLGRMGGEEFAMVLPGVSRDEALLVAERIRATVAAHAFGPGTDGGPLRATISIGVSHRSGPDGAAHMDSLLLAADAALYRAKAQGRDRVVAA